MTVQEETQIKHLKKSSDIRTILQGLIVAGVMFMAARGCSYVDAVQEEFRQNNEINKAQDLKNVEQDGRITNIENQLVQKEVGERLQPGREYGKEEIMRMLDEALRQYRDSINKK